MHCLSCTGVSAFRPKWVAVAAGTRSKRKLCSHSYRKNGAHFCGMRPRWWSKRKVTNWIDSGVASARRCTDEETGTLRSQRRGSRTMLQIACTALLLGLVSQISPAHDHSRPELNRWFDSLKSGKGPCCSVADGLAIADPDWESKDGHYGCSRTQRRPCPRFQPLPQ